MLSETELAAIDDWRFANRVATRSEAMRRLCQLALLQEAKLDKMKGLVEWSQGWAEEAITAYSDEHGLEIDVAQPMPDDAPKFLEYAKTAASVSSIVATMLEEMKSGSDIPELPQLPEPGPLVFDSDTARILDRLGKHRVAPRPGRAEEREQ